MSVKPSFLTLEETLKLHEMQLLRFGGSAGIRDLGLLESALGAPQASFGGEYLHPTLFDMAAAYLFHICSNHPFVDGNKRVAVLAALVFLALNGYSWEAAEDELEALVMRVAQGQAAKPEIAACFGAHCAQQDE